MTCAFLSREPILSLQLLFGGLGSFKGSLPDEASLTVVALLVRGALSSSGGDLYGMGWNSVDINCKFYRITHLLFVPL